MAKLSFLEGDEISEDENVGSSLNFQKKRKTTSMFKPRKFKTDNEKRMTNIDLNYDGDYEEENDDVFPKELLERKFKPKNSKIGTSKPKLVTTFDENTEGKPHNSEKKPNEKEYDVDYRENLQSYLQNYGNIGIQKNDDIVMEKNTGDKEFTELEDMDIDEDIDSVEGIIIEGESSDNEDESKDLNVDSCDSSTSDTNFTGFEIKKIEAERRKEIQHALRVDEISKKENEAKPKVESEETDNEVDITNSRKHTKNTVLCLNGGEIFYRNEIDGEDDEASLSETGANGGANAEAKIGINSGISLDTNPVIQETADANNVDLEVIFEDVQMQKDDDIVSEIDDQTATLQALCSKRAIQLQHNSTALAELEARWCQYSVSLSEMADVNALNCLPR